MSDSDYRPSGGIGSTGALTLIFIVLKLVGTVTWSWWWVLSPIWLVWGVVSFCLLCALLVHLVTN